CRARKYVARLFKKLLDCCERTKLRLEALSFSLEFEFKFEPDLAVRRSLRLSGTTFKPGGLECVQDTRGLQIRILPNSSRRYPFPELWAGSVAGRLAA